MNNQQERDTIAVLINQLRSHQDNRVLRQAATELGVRGAGNAEALQALLELLQHNQDEITRWAAIESLGKIGSGNSEVINILIEQLRTARIPSRRIAARSLGKMAIGNQEAIAALSDLVRSSRDDVTHQCAGDVLASIGTGNQEAIDTLIYLLDNSLSSSSWERILGNLRRIDNGDREIINAFLQVLGTAEDDRIRKKVMLYLSEIGVGNPQVIDAFTEMVQRPGSDGWTTGDRMTAVQRLMSVDPHNEQIVNHMLQWLRNCQKNSDIEELVRFFIMLGVGVGNSKVINAFSELLQTNQDRSIRCLVFSWLREIAKGTTPNAIGILNEQLQKSTDPWERILIAGILGEMGAEITEMSEILQELLPPDSHPPDAIEAMDETRPSIEAMDEILWIDETLDEFLSMDLIPTMAIDSLGIISLNNSDAVRVLIGLLQTFHADEDADKALKMDVIITLGKYGYGKPDVIDALADFVQNTSSPTLCGIAIHSLGQVGAANQKAIDIFSNWAKKSGKILLKIEAMNETWNEIWDETRDETFLLMHDICHVAIESLAIITVNNPDAVRVLIDILQTFHADGEYGYGKPDVIDALADFVQNTSSPMLCKIAMRSLGQVGAANQKAIDTLRNWAQNSQDEEIRQMAAECLISISDDRR